MLRRSFFGENDEGAISAHKESGDNEGNGIALLEEPVSAKAVRNDRLNA